MKRIIIGQFPEGGSSEVQSPFIWISTFTTLRAELLFNGTQFTSTICKASGIRLCRLLLELTVTGICESNAHWVSYKSEFIIMKIEIDGDRVVERITFLHVNKCKF